MKQDNQKRMLFVCLGNICRSPAAEGIMQHKLTEAGITNITVDSAGTYGGHSGEKADSRMRAAAAKRGYNLTSRSRKVCTEDFWEFDYIFVMDDSNFRDMNRLAPDVESARKVERITRHCTKHTINHVPDPYYEGARGFEIVLDILDDACDNILRMVSGK